MRSIEGWVTARRVTRHYGSHIGKLLLFPHPQTIAYSTLDAAVGINNQCLKEPERGRVGLGFALQALKICLVLTNLILDYVPGMHERPRIIAVVVHACSY